MTSSVVGALRVNLSLDSARFSRGMTDAQKSLARAQKQFAAVAGAATVAFASIAAAALKGAQAIDDNAKAARRIGATVAGYRALEMAADDAGVSLSSLADNVQTMNRELAKGGTGAQNALRTLGLAASDLADLDADQKLALIADRVKALGLDSGQTTALLQGLGIRSREMALLVMGGGDALRAARVDVEQFGLAISDVDAARIEAANDELAGLADITAYIGDQLALKFVPAMGNMAKAMTDSLREGGALRIAIDALIGNLDVFAVSIGAVITALGAKVLALRAATSGLGIFTTAAATARGALAALLGPMGLVYIAIGAGAAAFIAHRNATKDADGAMTSAESAARDLSIELDQMAREDLPNASAGTVKLANDNLSLARSAYAAAQAQVELAKATQQAAFTQSSLEDAFLPGVENPGRAAYEAANAGLMASVAALKAAEEELNARVFEGNQVKNEAADVVENLRREVEDLENEVSGQGSGSRGATPALRELDLTIKDTDRSAVSLADTFGNGLASAVDSVASAFSDFMLRGLRDFRSFASSILDTFKRMIAQMIATAIANPIKIALGFGGSIAGTAASAGTGLLGSAGGMLGGLGAFAGGIGSGLSVVGSGFMAGGFGGAATATMGAISGGLGAGGAIGFGTALGAAIPVIGAVALAFGALRTTTKTLDSGISVSVNNIGSVVKEFEKIQKSRFFGLSKSTSTNETIVRNSPIAGAIAAVQDGVRQAAKALGFGADAFAGFSHSFRLSLRGLSEDQKLQAINAEIASMGDAFAAMIPHISSVNELLEVANQRVQLEDQILQLQGRDLELLNRIRDRERAAINALNLPLLEQVYALQDQAVAAAAAAEAVAKGNAAIERTMDLFRQPLTLDSSRFNDRFSATIQAAEDRRFEIQKQADSAQLTELKLVRMALDELRKEQRDMRLYGVGG